MADLETIELVKDIDVDKYKYGFETDIESEYAPKGLNEDIVRFISAKKNEPRWMLEARLEAYRRWLQMEEPTWAKVSYPKIDFQDLYYYAAPKACRAEEPRRGRSEAARNLRQARHSAEGAGDPRGVRKQGEKSDLDETGSEYGSGKVAVDAVFDSVSVVTTFKAELAKAGVIFCSISEALREHPELVQKYLFSVVPQGDNYYAALNAAVFSDGSFVYVPRGVRCPMELSTYFRMNAKNTGQFERTLIIADKGSYVSYLEGCTAPTRDESQLHAAVVELIALDDAEIKYSTVQNWYPGDAEGKGGIYNFVTKRGDCRGPRSRFPGHRSKRFRHHLEVPELHPARRGIARRVLFHRHFQRPPAGGLRNQDDPSRQEHVRAYHLQGHRGGPLRQHLSRPRLGAPQGDERPELHPVRLAPHRRPVRRAHRALHRVQDLDRPVRTRATTSKISDDQMFYCMSRGLSKRRRWPSSSTAS